MAHDKRAPCKGCTEETGRKPGCHSHCHDYKIYKKKMEERNEEINKKREEFYPTYPIRKGQRAR